MSLPEEDKQKVASTKEATKEEELAILDSKKRRDLYDQVKKTTDALYLRKLLDHQLGGGIDDGDVLVIAAALKENKKITELGISKIATKFVCSRSKFWAKRIRSYCNYNQRKYIDRNLSG
jgi:hypothetical protein